jgi:hypothetical protein
MANDFGRGTETELEENFIVPYNRAVQPHLGTPENIDLEFLLPTPHPHTASDHRITRNVKAGYHEMSIRYILSPVWDPQGPFAAAEEASARGGVGARAHCSERLWDGR